LASCQKLRPALAHVAEGEAGPDEALAVARHLSDCTACRILLAREVRLEQALRTLDDPVPVNEGFVDGVMGSLPPQPRRRRRRVRLTIAGGASAILLALLGALRLPLPIDPRAAGLPSLDALPIDRVVEVAGAAAVWARLALEGFGLPGLPSFALRSFLPAASLAAAGMMLGLIACAAFVLAISCARQRTPIPPA